MVVTTVACLVTYVYAGHTYATVAKVVLSASVPVVAAACQHRITASTPRLTEIRGARISVVTINDPAIGNTCTVPTPIVQSADIAVITRRQICGAVDLAVARYTAFEFARVQPAEYAVAVGIIVTFRHPLHTLS